MDTTNLLQHENMAGRPETPGYVAAHIHATTAFRAHKR